MERFMKLNEEEKGLLSSVCDWWVYANRGKPKYGEIRKRLYFGQKQLFDGECPSAESMEEIDRAIVNYAEQSVDPSSAASAKTLLVKIAAFFELF